ncbi:MAG: LOG family protein [Hyphomicrobiaceae bacterium]|nr:MAG: LOG family protein [Hyphomicrobiaceae bacterium]
MSSPEDNHAQLRSRSYLLPVEDMEFLLRDEMRSIRFALEYGKAELSLRDWGVRSTVVVFGGSRVPSPEEAEALLQAARGKEAVAAAKRRAALSVWYEQARLFGRIVSERGGALLRDHGPRDNVIATGGGPGIMEAANRGAADAGAPSIGFNITLPSEQEPNRYSTPDLTFRFHYFAMRKMHLAMRANALAVFPGGFGTFDELFEILNLQQTGKAPPMPVVLFGKAYWNKVVNFAAMVVAGLVEKEDLKLFDIVDDAEAAWQSMTRRGLIAHVPPGEEVPPGGKA